MAPYLHSGFFRFLLEGALLSGSSESPAAPDDDEGVGLSPPMSSFFLFRGVELEVGQDKGKSVSQTITSDQIQAICILTDFSSIED